MRSAWPGPLARFCSTFALILAAACGPPEELRPDERLQEELGVSARTETHRVSLSGGRQESAQPAEVTVPPGALVEFVSTDSWVHEVLFELDSLAAEARAFLEDSDQVASPPMVNRDARFVVSWEGAPAGRYPFVLRGSGESARGAVVVSLEEG